VVVMEEAAEVEEAAADMEAVEAVAEAVEAVEAIVTDLLSQEWSRIAIALALRRGLFIARRSALRVARDDPPAENHQTEPDNSKRDHIGEIRPPTVVIE
jgi:hypothetical protein